MDHVLWLPAHPASGAVSMDRYWRELERERRTHAARNGVPAIRCPLGPPPPLSREAARPVRVWQKYCAYPAVTRLAARLPGTRVAHLLDHSYAHLLAGLPRRGLYKIATVHDLAPLQEAGELTDVQRRRYRQVVAHLHRADLILADSRHSAGETISLLGIEPGKLRVLPLGVDCDRFRAPPAMTPEESLPVALAGRKVVLSVGVTIPRKNLQVLPAVFRCLQMTGVTLLRVGTLLPASLAAELRAILGPGGVVELGPASDNLLVQAYQRADALIFPSLAEGFGLPVLEAMAAGCPVVCTNVTSLPEVGGEAAHYFAPDDWAAAAGHLRRLLTDATVRESVVTAGLRQAAAFSWTRHFERLLEVYRDGIAMLRGLP